MIDGVLYRLGMDCYPVYGSQARAFRITDLSPSTYVEKMIETLVKASSKGWNALAMHHVDAFRTWWTHLAGDRLGPQVRWIPIFVGIDCGFGEEAVWRQ